MEIPNLQNISPAERELYAHAYEIISRLKNRKLELKALMDIETDKIKRSKYAKEYTNINRWVADVTQAPETFSSIDLDKYTDKQLGQRVHTVARSIMDRFNIDPRKASAGGSTQHHIDSLTQMQPAYANADVETIFRMNQTLKEEGIYLGTNAEGRNFYDVDAATHPDFHKLSPKDQVDYTNKFAKINEMPTATVKQRLAQIRASHEITNEIANRAAQSSLFQARGATIEAVAETVDPGIVKRVGQPFDPSITGEASLVRAKGYREALKQSKEFMSGDIDYIRGGATLNKAKLATLTALAATGVAALGPLGTAASAAELAGRTQIAKETGDPADQFQAGLAGASLAGDVVSYFPPAAPIGEAVSTSADVGNILMDVYREDPERAKRIVKQQAQRLIPSDPIVRPVQRAVQAVQRGGKVKIGFNGAKFTLPELGLSELLGFN